MRPAHGQLRNDRACCPKKAAFFLKPNLNLKDLMTSFGIPLDPCRYRFGWQSDLEILRAQIGEDRWHHFSRLLEFSCTKPEWLVLGFAAGTLAASLVLAAPSEFSLPLEIIRLHGGLDERIDSLRLFQMAIEKARALGARELYCTIPEDSIDAASYFQDALLPVAKGCPVRILRSVRLRKCGATGPPKPAVLHGPR